MVFRTGSHRDCIPYDGVVVVVAAVDPRTDSVGVAVVVEVEAEVPSERT